MYWNEICNYKHEIYNHVLFWNLFITFVFSFENIFKLVIIFLWARMVPMIHVLIVIGVASHTILLELRTSVPGPWPYVSQGS